MHQPSVLSAFAAVLATLPAARAGMYTKSSPVLQVDARSYEKLISQSNHTSIVEFYAPWCGHCQNLKPAYEKVAKNLDGLAKVAAVDCDDDANKQLCGALGVQGFPTLKIVRPSKKAGGKPVVEDYRGERKAGPIQEAVMSKINNHVERVTDKDLDGFLQGDRPKAILFTEKGTTSALLRSIAIDFLDVITVGQIRNKDKAAVDRFGIDKFPTLVLVPAEGESHISYDGDMNKKDMVEFLRQAGEPNPDPTPGPGKKDKKKPKKDKASSSATKPAEDQATAEPEESAEPSTADTTTDTTDTSAVPTIIPIASITDNIMLVQECLQPKSHTCVLALVPSGDSDDGDLAVKSLSQLNTKYIHGKRHTFPFFSLSSDLEGGLLLRQTLELGQGVEVIALNIRRGWWRQYEGDFSAPSVEAWIDAMRMGEGEKKKLPDAMTKMPGNVKPGSEDPVEEESSTESTQATDPEPEVETEAPEREEKIVHEDL